jgi:GGDEF domain-containing protein
MPTEPYTLLSCGGPAAASPAALAASAWGPFAIETATDLGAAAARLAQGPLDALVVALPDEAAWARLLRWPSLAQAVRDAAVLLVGDATVPAAARLASLGVQDVLPADVSTDTLARALRLAIERQRRHARVRDASGTDLATGLPHRAQLLEHMTQLLALREREPAPMALLVLRVEGLAAAEATMGLVGAQILRRKAAVRLRASLRASDVVATLDRDTYAVLLAWIDQPADAPRVAQKLVQSLQRPLRVAGGELSLVARAGVGLYPAQGRDAEALLRAALHEAGQGGDAGARAPDAAAANDDAA